MTWANTNSAVVDSDESKRYLIEKYGADNQPLGTGLDTGGRPLTGCQKVDVFLISAVARAPRHEQVRANHLQRSRVAEPCTRNSASSPKGPTMKTH
jgi:hypothetical protein